MAGAIALASAVARRDVAIAFRQGGGWLQGIVFYLAFVGLSAFALGPEEAGLRNAAVAVAWLAMLFSIQLAVSEMFVDDLQDGTLATLAAEQAALAPYVVGKSLALLGVAGAPLLAASPLALIMFAVPQDRVFFALPALSVGAAALTLATLVAAAATTALRGGGRATSLLAAPLAAPVLIFGLGATRAALEGAVLSPDFLFLSALAVFFTALAPGFAALALRLGLE